ncbi:MAG: hypothetical protein HY675_00835 [Chloroflexi bacterium]|nr:hypothetical protein [Chloroflexota bacterium]
MLIDGSLSPGLLNVDVLMPFLTERTGLVGMDALSWLIVWICGGVATIVILSAIGAPRFFSLIFVVFFFLGSTFATVAINNLLLFYGSWELTAIAGWGIGKVAMRGNNTFLGALPVNGLGSLGSVSMLTLVLLLFMQNRDLSMLGLETSSPTLVALLLLAAVLLKSFGLLSTAWFKGDGRTFSIGNAALAGAGVIAVGIYPYLRITADVLGPGGEWREAAVWTTLGIAALFSFAALREFDLYKLVFYATLSQLCVLIATITFPRAQLSGWVLMLVPFVAGSVGLFLAAGLAEQAARERNTGRMGNLARREPVLALLFFLCLMSAAGVPPLGSFVGKLLISQDILGRDDIALLLLWTAIWIITVWYLLRAFSLAFLGASSQPSFARANRLAMLPLAITVGFLFYVTFWQNEVISWTTAALMFAPG